LPLVIFNLLNYTSESPILNKGNKMKNIVLTLFIVTATSTSFAETAELSQGCTDKVAQLNQLIGNSYNTKYNPAKSVTVTVDRQVEMIEDMGYHKVNAEIALKYEDESDSMTFVSVTEVLIFGDECYLGSINTRMTK
jgi:hypothetical protein